MRAKVLAGGASTQSRGRRPLPPGWHPLVISRSGGSEIWQVETDDGRTFRHQIDVGWCLDQGGPILGYTGPENRWTEVILRAVDRCGMLGPGSIASLPEVRAAELLIETVGPFIRGDDLRVRWLANGSDACDAAIRLARYHRRNSAQFISIGYHGCSMIFGHEPQHGGIPDETIDSRIDIAFGDTATMNLYRDMAAIIVEVPSTDQDASSFLAACRETCDKTGALLILDEVVTGFRLALGGAAEYYGIRPDLVCYGKAMSNGRNISALVGRKELMDPLADKVFHSATYNGDPWNCAHVIGALWTLGGHKAEIYPHLWDMGEKLKSAMAQVGIAVAGHGPRTFIDMPEDERRAFCAKMVERGVMMDRPQYTTMLHNDRAIALTAEAARSALDG